MQEVQGLNRGEVVKVSFTQPVDDLLRKRCEHRELHLRLGLACAWRKMRRGLLLGVFMFVQYFARADHHLGRKSRELADFNAVAAVGGSGLDLAQENDAAGILLYRYVEILD